MPRGLHNWTAEDVMRFLRDHGFVHNYTHGSHMFYVGKYAGALRQVYIPFHGSRTLKLRTLKSIILQSGIPEKEWTG